MLKISNRMPVLKSLERQNLKNICICICAHITEETEQLVRKLHNSGARIFLTASNPSSTQDEVARRLKEMDVTCYSHNGESIEKYNENIRDILDEVVGEDSVILVDDGADLINAYYDDYSGLISVIGGTEQTTAGVIRHKKRKEQEFPIVLVNDAQTKHLFDNVYGTGQSTLAAILNRFPEWQLNQKRFAIIGYGNCGRGVANVLRGVGAEVWVRDTSPVKQLQAYADGYNVFDRFENVGSFDMVITATGCVDAIDDRDIYDMRGIHHARKTYFANVGHFDVEINKQAIKKYRDTDYPTLPMVELLDDGRLFNLCSSTGHSMEAMDMSAAGQYLAVKMLVTDDTLTGLVDVSSEVDEMIAVNKLESLGIKAPSLTPEQKQYLRVE